MGRHRREYPQGKLRLKYNKNDFDKQKAYTLYFEYTWLDDAPIRKDTGLRVRVADWNEKGISGKGELRASYGNDYKRQNSLLHQMLSEYDTTLQEYSQKHLHQMSSEIIRSILNGAPLTRKDEAKDFVEYVVATLKSKMTRNKISKSRYENGVCCMNGFTQFLTAKGKGTYKEDAIYLGDISAALVEEYIDYRRNVKKNVDATINHALTPIIFACEQAKDEELIDAKTYVQIKQCRLDEAPKMESEAFDGKSALTKEELQKLVDFYEQDTEPRRKEYIEMFLFAFHAGGMRLVDVMTLTWANINFEKRELRKTLIKTARGENPRHTIPLNDAAIAILNKWKGMGRRQKFVFDLVQDDFNVDDEGALYYRRNTVDRSMNQCLAVVREKARIQTRLTFHVARHTFAVLALNDGMSLSVVSRMLGHATTDITERVYAEYLPITLADELTKLNYNFLPKDI